MKRKAISKRKKKSTLPSLITGHLDGIKRALLDGEKRPAFLDFLDTEIPAKRGIYALYDEKGRLHYTGKATDLSKRLNQHLKDKHGTSWDRMTLFLVGDSLTYLNSKDCSSRLHDRLETNRSQRLDKTFVSGCAVI